MWRSLGSWSGHGSEQTDSFTSDTGALRIQWEAKSSGNSPAARHPNGHSTAQSPRGGGPDAAAALGVPVGTFRLTIHSSISGRPLSSAVVDHKGAGKGTAFVSEDPRVFFAVVESKGLDWSFTIEERLR